MKATIDSDTKPINGSNAGLLKLFTKDVDEDVNENVMIIG